MSLSASLTRRPRGSCNKSDVAPCSWWWLWNICGEWHLPEGPIGFRLSLLQASHRCLCWWQVLHFWCFVDSSGRFEVRYALAFHAEIHWLPSTLLLTPSIKAYSLNFVSLYCVQRIPELSTSDRVKIQDQQPEDQQPEASVRYLNHKLDQLCIFLSSSFILILETMCNIVQFCDYVPYEW